MRLIRGVFSNANDIKTPHEPPFHASSSLLPRIRMSYSGYLSKKIIRIEDIFFWEGGEGINGIWDI